MSVFEELKQYNCQTQNPCNILYPFETKQSERTKTSLSKFSQKCYIKTEIQIRVSWTYPKHKSVIFTVFLFREKKKKQRPCFYDAYRNCPKTWWRFSGSTQPNSGICEQLEWPSDETMGHGWWTEKIDGANNSTWDQLLLPLVQLSFSALSPVLHFADFVLLIFLFYQIKKYFELNSFLIILWGKN